MSYPLVEIINMLDETFNIREHIGKDTSFVKRISDYFNNHLISRFEHGFVGNCNGPMILGSALIERIYGATFLSDGTLVELIKQNPENSLLIVHHPLDIEGGINDLDFIGYRAVSSNLLLSYIEKGGNVYSLHLPLDVNKYEINTHSAFLKYLSLQHNEISPLLTINNHEYGYMLNIEATPTEDIIDLIDKRCPRYLQYGASIDATKITRIGLLAGMISSLEQLRQIENIDCDLCICGDLFIRDGSKRYLDLHRAVSESNTSFICLSHNISEYQVFDYGLFPLLNSLFPKLDCHGLLGTLFR